MHIKIGSRKSDLAVMQAKSVGDALKNAFPATQVSHLLKPSLGDLNQDINLSQTDSKGVFTTDLLDLLTERECDLLVHSWKDLPIDENPKSEVIGTLPREDSRDLLFLKKKSLGKEKICILTSSPRRVYNISEFGKELFPNVEFSFKEVRGNIPTRFEKFISIDEADGFIVAIAAVKRLFDWESFNLNNPGLWGRLNECSHWAVLPESICPSAAAQGALAIEIARGASIKQEVESISCSRSFSEIREERLIHKSHGGGCHLALGVTHKKLNAGDLTIVGGSPNGTPIKTISFRPRRGDYPTKISSDELWVSSTGLRYSREKLSCSIPEAKGGRVLVFTREDSVPSDFIFQDDDLIFCSGVQTWKKLSKRGLWVNGCFDSLGVSQYPELFDRGRKRYWFTRSGVAAPRDFELVESYSLTWEMTNCYFKEKTYYAWMSGELLKECLEKYSFLANKMHFVGLGRSSDVLSELKGIKVFPFYSLTQLKEDILL